VNDVLLALGTTSGARYGDDPRNPELGSGAVALAAGRPAALVWTRRRAPKHLLCTLVRRCPGAACTTASRMSAGRRSNRG
jgi:hypothetical protein